MQTIIVQHSAYLRTPPAATRLIDKVADSPGVHDMPPAIFMDHTPSFEQALPGAWLPATAPDEPLVGGVAGVPDVLEEAAGAGAGLLGLEPPAGGALSVGGELLVGGVLPVAGLELPPGTELTPEGKGAEPEANEPGTPV
ncbi:uncharacterized protein AB675_2993 [Cyphellophora attinorum]|uniref:Uncharacterized protein n=1 Tax=Cyphellophora attinorum TaxID=1664694 RepID=A0A0N1NW96_9EURO|nr:uncharacterized protein AB675_2993 [Phialophora attinorum]KPI36425.1 hypothetical protein AB675_2993 [Phialophora attinorum]